MCHIGTSKKWNFSVSYPINGSTLNWNRPPWFLFTQVSFKISLHRTFLSINVLNLRSIPLLPTQQQGFIVIQIQVIILMECC